MRDTNGDQIAPDLAGQGDPPDIAPSSCGQTRIDDAVRGGSTIARAGLADAVLRVLLGSGTHRHTVDVAY